MTTATFDVHAASYDQVAESALGQRYRARIHAILDRFAPSSPHVLDLGCGTGLDAAWWHQRGATVTGVDASRAMLDLAEVRVAGADDVRFVQADLGQPAWPEVVPASVDMVIANFGVVNCLPDLAAFGGQVAEVLRPGGHAVVVTMPTFCPPERLQALITRNRPLGTRRSSTATYGPTGIRYATASDLAAEFDGLDLIHSEALGALAPSFEQRRHVERRPRLLALLDRSDRLVSRAALRLGWGDHHVAVFRKAP